MMQTVLLGNEIELAYGKGLPRPTRVPGRYPVFGSNGQVDTHEKAYTEGPGVIVGRKGSVGEVIWTDRDFWPIDTTYYVKLKNQDDSLRYWYYQLKALGLNLLNSHSAIPGLNRDVAYSKQVIKRLPEEQKRIADILGTIDEKIELNRKMNETLEQMGQAQFRHYFIDSSSADTLKIDDIAEVIDCLHSKKPERVKEDSDNILLQLNNVNDDGTLDLTDRYLISDEDYRKWTSRIEATENDFVITNVGRSGAVAKIPADTKAALGRNMTAIRLKSETNFPGFLSFLLNSKYMKKQIESRLDHGTILSALNVKTIPKLTLPTGNTELIFDHEKEFKNLRSMIETNARATQTLISLRDTLLLRLINGKISLKG